MYLETNNRLEQIFLKVSQQESLVVLTTNVL
jgi:hypothetical protein